MKKKNILILTSEYPNPNSTFDTPVVHYYAKEWVEMGHSVRVIHYRSVFPAFFYFFARNIKKILKRVFGTDFIPSERMKESISYSMDKVQITSRPIFKIFPHFKFFDSTVRMHANLIKEENEAFSFTPDIIIGHFFNPQLPLIAELKNVYPSVKSSLVLHENPSVIRSVFGKKSDVYLDKLDYIGFRFEEMRRNFVSVHITRARLFICPSGIPDSYLLSELPKAKFESEVLTFCFVGMLIPLKNVDILLEALYKAFPNKNFKLRILGEGMLQESIEQMIAKFGFQNNVTMEGKIPRSSVQDVLKDVDVFVMVSKPEAFGLVYLEAMSKGCLTIGTLGQGIDGVINHGINGFLCEARDVAKLSELFKEIEKLEYTEKVAIANAAMETASNLTDKKVAYSYLQKIGIN